MLTSPIMDGVASLYFTRPGAITGKDPVTRQPIRAAGTEFVLAARVVHANRPVVEVFPGADETHDLLKGRFLEEPPTDVIHNRLCQVSIDSGATRMEAQIRMLASNTADPNAYTGRTKKGQMFYLMVKRG